MNITTARRVLIAVPYRAGYKYMWCDDTWTEVSALRILNNYFKDEKDAKRLVKLGVSSGLLVTKKPFQPLDTNRCYYDNQCKFYETVQQYKNSGERHDKVKWYKLKSGAVLLSGTEATKAVNVLGRREVVYIVPVTKDVCSLLHEKDINADFKYNYGYYRNIHELDSAAITYVYTYDGGHWIVHEQTERGLVYLH